MQLAFFVDSTKCIGCKTCEVACKDFNDLAPGPRIRKVRTFEGGEFPDVYAYNVSMSCNHCDDPACVSHCPAGAYTKRAKDGVVVHDPDRCIGCRYCTWVCPYGAPQYDARAGHVWKCNFCVSELDAGRAPACVAACPMRAIEFGPLEEIAKRPGAAVALRDLPPPGITKPSIRYRARKEAAL